MSFETKHASAFAVRCVLGAKIEQDVQFMDAPENNIRKSKRPQSDDGYQRVWPQEDWACTYTDLRDP